jgi:hypothetical protein
MDVDMDVDMETGAKQREAKPSFLAARQRRTQNFATATQMPTSGPSSTSTSSFPSPMNNVASTVGNPPFEHQMTAPLPSPSASDLEPVWPRSQSAMPHVSNPHFQQPQATALQPNFSTQQSHPYGHQPQQGMTNNPAATTSFLKDFNLVAEAAKRAQMAVVMRDLEGISL